QGVAHLFQLDGRRVRFATRYAEMAAWHDRVHAGCQAARARARPAFEERVRFGIEGEQFGPGRGARPLRPWGRGGRTRHDAGVSRVWVSIRMGPRGHPRRDEPAWR